MFAVTVLFRIEPGAMKRFMPLIDENAEKSLELEAGCKRFEICTDPGRPVEVFLYELYDDAAAFAAHKTAAHYARFDTAAAHARLIRRRHDMDATQPKPAICLLSRGPAAGHRHFRLATKIEVYFCDPQSPWQRGSKENTYRLLRQ